MPCSLVNWIITFLHRKHFGKLVNRGSSTVLPSEGQHVTGAVLQRMKISYMSKESAP